LLHVFVVIAFKIQLFCMKTNCNDKELVFPYKLNMHATLDQKQFRGVETKQSDITRF